MPFASSTPFTARNPLLGQMGTPSAFGVDFPPPFEPPSQSKSGPSASSLASDYHNIDSPNFLGPSSDYSHGGGMDMSQMLQMAQSQAQMAKLMADYQAQVKLARFMLPQTLKQIGSQYGSQGDYYSSGRRQAQQTAIWKTSYDLQQAKRDTQLQKQLLQLQEMQSMMGRSGGG